MLPILGSPGKRVLTRIKPASQAHPKSRAGSWLQPIGTGKFMPMLSGVLLNLYPFFTDDIVWLAAIGLVLLAAPFVIDL